MTALGIHVWKLRGLEDHQADLCSDVLGTVGVGESVARLLEVEAGRTDMSDHHRLAVAAECIFEQSSQLAVPIVYILTARLVACTKMCRFRPITDGSM